MKSAWKLYFSKSPRIEQKFLAPSVGHSHKFLKPKKFLATANLSEVSTQGTTYARVLELPPNELTNLICKVGFSKQDLGRLLDL